MLQVEKLMKSLFLAEMAHSTSNTTYEAECLQSSHAHVLLLGVGASASV